MDLIPLEWPLNVTVCVSDTASHICAVQDSVVSISEVERAGYLRFWLTRNEEAEEWNPGGERAKESWNFRIPTPLVAPIKPIKDERCWAAIRTNLEEGVRDQTLKLLQKLAMSYPRIMLWSFAGGHHEKGD